MSRPSVDWKLTEEQLDILKRTDVTVRIKAKLLGLTEIQTYCRMDYYDIQRPGKKGRRPGYKQRAISTKLTKPEEQIADISNLRMIPWEVNVKRKKYASC